jgi:hypothetical protein
MIFNPAAFPASAFQEKLTWTGPGGAENED